MTRKHFAQHLAGALISLGALGAGSALAQTAAAPAAPSAATSITLPTPTEIYKEIRITVQGEGRPVLMIPGLNSGAEVWTDTCKALQPGVQCHMVHLPGFAGAPASPTASEARFIDTMRDRLLDYIDERKLARPVVMGHSLGGVLAMTMAVQQPAAVDRIVIVDSLPFLAGIRNPSATADSVKGMAEAMRNQMRNASPEVFAAQTKASANGMTRAPGGTDRVVAMGLASDRNTTAQAMSELWGLDLRPVLPKIQTPTLVLGAWAAYAPMGATMLSTQGIFESQYQGLPKVQVRMSETAYHFIMWDDLAWTVAQVKGFMAP